MSYRTENHPDLNGTCRVCGRGCMADGDPKGGFCDYCLDDMMLERPDPTQPGAK